MPVLELTPYGLYCPAGDFHVDPHRAVPRAIITHGHSDHARRGSSSYVCHHHSGPILAARLGEDCPRQTVAYGECLTIGRARVSLHPAGHVLGSAQIRVEVAGEVWVVSGDYKCQSDLTCADFEPVKCHTFITESTFALPIYQWRPPSEVFAEINNWWRANQAAGKTSVLFAYTLGKAQRLIAGVDHSIGPMAVHDSVAELLPAYHAAGIPLPPTLPLTPDNIVKLKGNGLIIAPQSAFTELSVFAPLATGSASGWQRVPGRRTSPLVQRGFVLSDHADWPGLLEAIAATGATSIGVTHGYTAQLVRYLREVKDLDAWTVGET